MKREVIFFSSLEFMKSLLTQAIGWWIIRGSGDKIYGITVGNHEVTKLSTRKQWAIASISGRPRAVKTILNFCTMSWDVSYFACRMHLHPFWVHGHWSKDGTYCLQVLPQKPHAPRPRHIQDIPTGTGGPPLLVTSEILGRGTSFDSVLDGSIHTWWPNINVTQVMPGWVLCKI